MTPSPEAPDPTAAAPADTLFDDDAWARLDDEALDEEAGPLAARLRAGPHPRPADTPDGGDTPAAGGTPGPEDVRLLVARAVAGADADGLVDVAWARVDSPIGALTLAATEVGIVRIGFGTEDAVLDHLAAEVSPRVLHLPARLDAARRQLDEYFAGDRRGFDLPLDRRLSRGYRRQVLEALSSTVPYGAVATYKDLAVATANPGAVRAVGTAMATNPIPIVVPCHRIVRSGGALGNYGGGPEVKAFLLRLEGAHLLL
jgi:methylated-DNA-[protein]-cysteine S-methyltransferase